MNLAEDDLLVRAVDVADAVEALRELDALGLWRRAPDVEAAVGLVASMIDAQRGADHRFGSYHPDSRGVGGELYWTTATGRGYGPLRNRADGFGEYGESWIEGYGRGEIFYRERVEPDHSLDYEVLE